jgi:methyl-accepting chemotaxis protein
MDMKNLSVSLRLLILVLIGAVVSIAIGLIGISGMSAAISSFDSVRHNELLHVRDLGLIADKYSNDIVDLPHKVRSGRVEWAQASKTLDEARKVIAERWSEHPPSQMTGDEKVLAQEIETLTAAAAPELDRLKQIFETEDRAALDKYINVTLYPTLDPISDKIAEFMNMQLDAAGEEFDRANDTYVQNKWLAVLVIVGGLVLGLMAAMFIVRSVTRPLLQVQSVVKKIETTGDFSQRIGFQARDEVGQTASAINRMLQSQQEAVSEVNRVVTAMAQGDLKPRIHADLRGDLAQMKHAVNASADAVQNTMAILGEVMENLQNGDFSAQIDAHAQGQYQETLDRAREAMHALRAMLGDVGAVMAQVAQGDLTRQVQAQGLGDLAILKDNINTSLSALAVAMTAIHANARQVAAASSETSHAIAQISDGSQNQTHAIAQLATAARQTSASVTDVSRNTMVASQKSQDSMTIMRQGMQQMELMVEVVNSIATNSAQINKITEVIEGIANKTNLLSLNAAIEAARAGEHGKGFSVVAEEVGKLAANSAESSQEIARLVQQAVTETARAVETVRQVKQGMAQIELGAQEADGMLQRISSALAQQTSAIEEINANLGSLENIARSNAAASEEMTATVMGLSQIAEATRRELDRFRI